MAATKVVQVLMDNVTLTAGAGDATSSLGTLTTGYGAEVDVKITNGATGPTVAAQVQLQVSEDNSNWYNLGGPLVAQLGNGVITSWGGISINPAAQYVQALAGSNTGQNVTCRVEVSQVTAIA